MKGLKYIVLACNIAFFAVMAMVMPLAFEENDDVQDVYHNAEFPEDF